MQTDENKLDLVSIYESILNPRASVIQEASKPKAEDEEESDEKVEESFKKKKALKKGKGKPSKEEAGRKYLGDSTSYTNYFDKAMKQIDEEFGMGAGFGDEEDENSFDYEDSGNDDFGGEDEFGMEGGEDANSILRGIYEQLKGYFEGEEEFEDDGGFGGENEFEDGDSIPSESYAFEGNGKEHGDQGDYDGKAKTQKPTDLVNADGSAKVGKSQVTGYKPGASGRGAAKSHGGQGNYNGKAQTQKPTDLVKPDGGAKVGQTQTTGYGKNKGEDYL